MPSGRKKRQAAKKKKGNEPNSITQNSSSSTHHSSENDDLRNHEERDSDGGENEVVSPASQGNQGSFTEGSEETEKSDEHLKVQSAVSESKSIEGDTVDSEVTQIVGVEKNGVVEIVKDVKLEDASESNSVDIECVEPVEILRNGDAKKPEGVGLNDDPRIDEKKLEVEPENVALEAPYSGNVVMIVDSLPKESTEITDTIPAVENSFSTDMVGSVPAVSEKVIYVAQTTAAEKAVHSGLDLKENEGKVLPPRGFSSEVSETITDISLKAEETVLPVTVEVAAKLSSYVANDEVSLPVEEHDKSLPISEGSTARAFYPVEKENTKKPESPENQPLVASPPRRVEKTSWLGCCGIFDVITGSR